MKVHIWCDERYPDYGVATNADYHSVSVEVSEEFYAEYRAVNAAYDAMQGKLEELAKKQTKPLSPAEPKFTQEELDQIIASTPVEDTARIQAAIDAVNARTKAA